MTNPNDSIHNSEQGTQDGLTKREYFAAMAMQGLLTNSNVLKFFQRDGLTADDFINLVSKDSTAISDALINALNQNK